MVDLTPSQKGGVAELAIAAQAAELGFVVARPMIEGARYDLIVDTGARLLRVQCKWASLAGDVVIIRMRTSRHTPQGYLRTDYFADEIDGVAAYCGALNAVYWLPIDEVAGQAAVQLRLAPAKNNQQSGVRMAEQYPLGAIAQLEERRHGMAEVVGSSPTSSTSTKAA